MYVCTYVCMYYVYIYLFIYFVCVCVNLTTSYQEQKFSGILQFDSLNTANNVAGQLTQS